MLHRVVGGGGFVVTVVGLALGKALGTRLAF